MPHKALKKSKPEYDPEYIQKKIDLIEKGLPVDIAEDELKALEESLRGARSFYIDILQVLYTHKDQDNTDVEKSIVEEGKNIVGIEMALRKIDEFREKHWSHIKNTI